MQHLLPARPRLFSALVLLLALLVRPALASHLLAGELTYRYLDADGPEAAPYHYEITLTIYNNCPTNPFLGPIPPATSADIGIYDQATGAKINLTALNSTLAAGGFLHILNTSPGYFESACLDPSAISGCSVNVSTPQPYILQKFVGTVYLPVNTQGYYAAYEQGARAPGIRNLSNPDSYYLGLYTAMAPSTIPNRSPVFSNVAVAVICSDTTLYLTNAMDADGDSLVYAFGAPYSINQTVLPTTFNPSTLATVPYAPGFTATTPFGTGPGILNQLNTSTGIATFATPIAGRYQVCIDVSEYRSIGGAKKVKIGSTRRDVVLVVGNCPPTSKPKAPSAINTSLRNLTIVAGTTATIPITSTQSDSHPLKLSLYSELLDGPGGYDATFNGNPGTVVGQNLGSVTVRGSNGTVQGNFVYKATCAAARATPYDVLITVADTGCGGKTIYDIAHITVVKPTGPSTITGDALVCGTSGTSTYTATGGTATGYAWSVTNGTIQGSSTGTSVVVKWNSVGTGSVTVTGTTPGGCLSDPLTKTVLIQAVPGLTLAGNRIICPGGSTTITASGGVAGATYTVTGGPFTGTGPAFVLSPSTTTTYTFTASGTATSCPAVQQATITVYPVVVANVGPAVTTTGNHEVTIGAAPVAGYTYSWSPATGLSSTTAANPTVNLPNYTGAPITQTYTLTTTSTATGCSGTASVVVTINVDLTLIIPNIVLPNSSSTDNKVLTIKNIRSFPGSSIEIYNRWGNRVFATTNYDNATNNWGGDPSTAPGIYYYLFKKVDGSTLKGWIEVVK